MIEDELRGVVAQAAAGAVAEVGFDGDVPEPELSSPKQKEHGDFSTNIALVLAARAGVKPHDLAEAMRPRIAGSDLVEDVQIAGPGFINLWVGDSWLHDAVREAIRRGDRYGWAAEPAGVRMQVEFVSANPTGPLHVGHARNAALGDALARVLEAAGCEVQREYYFNDTGGQMDRFGESVEARYLQLVGRDAEVPDDGYHGSYIKDIAADILREAGASLADLPEKDRFERLRAEGTRRALDAIRGTLERFAVRFDAFVSEEQLSNNGEIDQAIERLRSSGDAYEAEGAVWFRSTAYGDEKDRPLVRSDGTHTYFGADCAYLIDKFRRGFDHLLYVWGADHHGNVARVMGAAKALGFDPDAVELLIYQFVSFVRHGEPVAMSKRAGDFVSLDQLIDEVGVDAARFTLLTASNDHTINFDIEAVKRETLENPSYYVQYAHARLASIMRRAGEAAIELKPIQDIDLRLLAEDAEVELMKSIAAVPEQVVDAAGARAPHRLTHAARAMASLVHRFYTEHKVISDDQDLTQARLALCSAAKVSVANLLWLVGATAPERMEREDG